jgi:D-amino-acid dehydrogenase
MHILIIGAGVVGLTTAYFLRAHGCDVTVMDAGVSGGGASRANGGQLSYAYVEPLATPATLAKLPQLLLARESPFAWRPRLEGGQVRWLLAFLAACRRRSADATSRALLELAAHSRDAFTALQQAASVACDWTQTGKLVLHPDPSSLAAARAQTALLKRLGVTQQVLDAEACIALEPALVDRRFAGGIHTPGEAAADCAAFCAGLERYLVSAGVRIVSGVPITGWSRASDRVIAVETPHGPGIADVFVIAAGNGSAALARMLDLSLGLYPLKGYSITLNLRAGARAPRVSVTDSRQKVVFAPLGDRLRVAGRVEVVGFDADLPPQRISALTDAARRTFGDIFADGDLSPWYGFRPATPQGRPWVSATRYHNVFLNTGHGALGFTLASGSARLLADLIAQRRASPALWPFTHPSAPAGRPARRRSARTPPQSLTR